MNRSTGVAGILAALLLVGLAGQAHGQQRVRLTGEASCIDGEGRYTITWTLTLTLRDQETATAETPASDFDGLDLIGQPQEEGYPFQAESGNIFTAGSGRLVNGANVARTQMNTRAYNPDTLTAAGRILLSGVPTEVEVTVSRPRACAA